MRWPTLNANREDNAMSHNTVLDSAEARLAPAIAAAQTSQKDIVTQMREEIGEQHYVRAKTELPNLEKFITQHARPYLDHLVRISQRAVVPLRSDIRAYVLELETLCLSGTDWVRAAITEWDRLAPPFETGTQRVDTMRRASEVGEIRKKLMNWDGKESRMRILMTLIENYIKDTGWPAVSASAAKEG
jgi:hypothetical protein